jgi:sulfite dehydrogenase (quinone) subunit SoeC
MGVNPQQAARRCRVIGNTDELPKNTRKEHTRMHPPWSMIFFTTLAGAAQGLLLALVGIELCALVGAIAPVPGSRFYGSGAVIALILGGIGLVAASFHLGHPLRAWRSAAMWRTSWLSREVIVLPAFLGCVALWAMAHALGGATLGWGLAASVLALVLYVCTGMIYAAIKAIREWATPLTPFNYLLLGLASGLMLCTALAAALAPQLVSCLAQAALILTVAGAVSRGFTFWRNLTLPPKTTLQTALGVRHPRIVQTSAGMTAGHFGTREFFHGRTAWQVTSTRWCAVLCGFVLPAAALVVWGSSLHVGLAAVLFLLQYLGLLAERWSFFAEGQHPQNLYQQQQRRG